MLHAFALLSVLSTCPVTPAWKQCQPINDAQRMEIYEALDIHVRNTPECNAAKSEIMSWLSSERAVVWTYAAHVKDRPLAWVGGNTLRRADSGRAEGVGFHLSAFEGDARSLARIAIHEGAHLAGADEDGARKIELQCA